MKRLLRLLKNPYRSIQSLKLRLKFRQHKITMGSDYPDKIFYVIRRIPPGEGMFSNIHNIMAHIKYAVNNHWIPLIDMQNYATRYDMSVPIMGSKNTWEHLFEQPFNYTLDMILHAKNISIIACSKKKAIGYASINFNISIRGGVRGYINDVVVEKEYRKKGIGKSLINILLKYAKKKKCFKIILESKKKDFNFYRSCGYKLNSFTMRKLIK